MKVCENLNNLFEGMYNTTCLLVSGLSGIELLAKRSQLSHIAPRLRHFPPGPWILIIDPLHIYSIVWCTCVLCQNVSNYKMYELTQLNIFYTCNIIYKKIYMKVFLRIYGQGKTLKFLLYEGCLFSRFYSHMN